MQRTSPPANFSISTEPYDKAVAACFAQPVTFGIAELLKAAEAEDVNKIKEILQSQVGKPPREIYIFLTQLEKARNPQGYNFFVLLHAPCEKGTKIISSSFMNASVFQLIMELATEASKASQRDEQKENNFSLITWKIYCSQQVKKVFLRERIHAALFSGQWSKAKIALDEYFRTNKVMLYEWFKLIIENNGATTLRCLLEVIQKNPYIQVQHVDQETQETVWHVVAKSGRHELIGVLEEYEKQRLIPNRMQQDHYGNLPLHWAALTGRKSLVNYFISCDTSTLHATNNYGDTPVILAHYGEQITLSTDHKEQYQQMIPVLSSQAQTNNMAQSRSASSAIEEKNDRRAIEMPLELSLLIASYALSSQCDMKKNPKEPANDILPNLPVIEPSIYVIEEIRKAFKCEMPTFYGQLLHSLQATDRQKDSPSHWQHQQLPHVLARKDEQNTDLRIQFVYRLVYSSKLAAERSSDQSTNIQASLKEFIKQFTEKQITLAFLAQLTILRDDNNSPLISDRLPQELNDYFFTKSLELLVSPFYHFITANYPSETKATYLNRFFNMWGNSSPSTLKEQIKPLFFFALSFSQPKETLEKIIEMALSKEDLKYIFRSTIQFAGVSYSMLHAAFMANQKDKKNSEIIAYLLENMELFGHPLRSVISSQEKDMIEIVYKNNFIFDADHLTTLLLLALDQGNLAMIKFLLDRGACLDRTIPDDFYNRSDDELRNIPLFQVIHSYDQAAFAFMVTITPLLQNKEPTDKYKKLFETLLRYSIKENAGAIVTVLSHFDPDLFQSLLVTMEDREKNTLLHYAATYAHPSLFIFLMAQGASLKKINTAGKSPLYIINERKDIELFMRYFQQEMEATGEPGLLTHFRMAYFVCTILQDDRGALTELLIQDKTLATAEIDDQGNQALHYLSHPSAGRKKNGEEITRCLIEAGDCNSYNNKGMTAFLMAARYANWWTLERILTYSPEAIQDRDFLQNQNALFLLYSNNNEINSDNENKEKTHQILMKKNKDLLVEHNVKNNECILHCAAINNNYSFIPFLVSALGEYFLEKSFETFSINNDLTRNFENATFFYYLGPFNSLESKDDKDKSKYMLDAFIKLGKYDDQQLTSKFIWLQLSEDEKKLLKQCYKTAKDQLANFINTVDRDGHTALYLVLEKTLEKINKIKNQADETNMMQIDLFISDLASQILDTVKSLLDAGANASDPSIDGLIEQFPWITKGKLQEQFQHAKLNHQTLCLTTVSAHPEQDASRDSLYDEKEDEQMRNSSSSMNLDMNSDMPVALGMSDAEIQAAIYAEAQFFSQQKSSSTSSISIRSSLFYPTHSSSNVCSSTDEFKQPSQKRTHSNMTLLDSTSATVGTIQPQVKRSKQMATFDEADTDMHDDEESHSSQQQRRNKPC
ncbi:MAG: hypothetical protein ACD_60C00054G0009 [uncultured bacterium]|nr:MAG: hypothetical protein ACD_60C00054G0009 [uncultured bacterium]